MPSDVETISIQESEWRNKVCAKLGNIEGRLDAGDSDFKAVKADIKDVKSDIKSLSDKLDTLFAFPCGTCEPATDIKAAKRWSIIALFGILIVLGKQALNFMGVLK